MKSKYYDVAAVREAISGPVPSISTAFLENGELDWESNARNVEFLIGSGAKTLLLTFGDSLLSILRDREVVELTKFVVEQTHGRAMVIGCGKPWCLPQTLEFTEECANAGCDVVIPVPPDWAQHCDSNMLTDYFKAVAQKAPVMLLSNLMNGRGTPMEVVERLTPEQGIVAIKDDTPTPYGRRLGKVSRDKFAYLSGGTFDLFLDTAPYGADGYLSVFFRCFPQVDHAFWKAYKEGRIADCVAINEKYEVPFFKWCAQNGANFDAGIRGMMEIAGITKRYCRMPYSHLTEKQVESLKIFLAERNLI
jgi:4-hydroxy-tetrahydrodipicolinate synthase